MVWTILYICMAWSGARVAVLPGNGQAMAFWALQIALNTLWTPVFFGLHRMRAGMIVIVCLWLAVAATTDRLLAARLRWPGCCFCPISSGSAIASALNLLDLAAQSRATA